MKKILFMMSVLLSQGLFSACSSNEEEMDNDPSSGLVTDADEKPDKIQVDYSLLNENGVPSTTFEYGEDIRFELTITNNSDKVLIFSDDIILGKDLFRVYLNDGTDMGTPWTSCATNYVGIGIQPKVSTSLACNWIKASTYPPLSKKEEFEPLPKGSYYTSFVIKYRDLNNKLHDIFMEKEYNIAFEVQ